MTERVAELEEEKQELIDQLANSTQKPKGENVYVAPAIVQVVPKEAEESIPNLALLRE